MSDLVFVVLTTDGDGTQVYGVYDTMRGAETAILLAQKDNEIMTAYEIQRSTFHK